MQETSAAQPIGARGCPPHGARKGIALDRIGQPRCGGESGSAIASRARPQERQKMSVDVATVRKIARLARVAVADDEVAHIKGELDAMLAFVQQLSEVDVTGVEPMTSVIPMAMKKRPDVVTDGGIAEDILKNAPATQDGFFLVPKVVE